MAYSRRGGLKERLETVRSAFVAEALGSDASDLFFSGKDKAGEAPGPSEGERAFFGAAGNKSESGPGSFFGGAAEQARRVVARRRAEAHEVSEGAASLFDGDLAAVHQRDRDDRREVEALYRDRAAGRAFGGGK